MFANRCGRRRLQAAVGPGHGRRRTFGSPDRDDGKDTEVADTSRDRRATRDRVTGDTARDPATGPTARDDHLSRRAWRRALRHATTVFCSTISGCSVMSSYVRLYPVMPGYVSEHFFWFYVPSLLAFCPVVRWCGCPVVRLSGGLMMFSYVLLCSVARWPDDVLLYSQSDKESGRS